MTTILDDDLAHDAWADAMTAALPAEDLVDLLDQGYPLQLPATAVLKTVVAPVISLDQYRQHRRRRRGECVGQLALWPNGGDAA